MVAVRSGSLVAAKQFVGRPGSCTSQVENWEYCLQNDL